MCVLLIKVLIRKKSGTLFNDPRTLFRIYISFVSEYFAGNIIFRRTRAHLFAHS